MDREIRVRWTGDASDLKRAIEEARRALKEVETGVAQSSHQMRDSFQQASQQAKKMGDESTQAIRKIASESVNAASTLKKMGDEAGKSRGEIQRVGTEANRTADNLRKMGTEGSGGASKMLGELGRLTAGFVSLSAAAAAFGKGIAYNSEIQSLQLGIASIVAANETVADSQGKQAEGAQKIAVAQGQVAQVFERLKKDAIDTTATLPELVQAFQATLVPATRLGISLDDSRSLAVRFTQAMGAMSIPLEQARQEIGSILQLNITSDSVLARNLGLTNEMVKSWQEQGKLVEKLNERLKDFATAGQMAGEQWAGAFSSLQDNIGTMLGNLTDKSFGSLTDLLNDFNKNTFGKDAQNQARQWGVIINDGLVLAIEGAKVLGGILFSSANGWLKLFQQAHAIGAFGSANTHRREGIQGAISGLQSLSTTDELYGSVAQYRRFGTVSDAQAFANQSMGYQGYKMSPAIQDAMLANLKQFAQDNNYDTPKIMAEARRMGLPPEVVNKLRKGLSDVENLFTKSMIDLSTDLSGQAVAAYKANVGNYKATPNKPAPATPKKVAGPSGSSIIYNFNQRNQLGKLNNGPLSDLSIGGLGSAPIVSFDSQVDSLMDVNDPTDLTGAPNESDDLLLRQIKGYKQWEKDEADKWNSLVSGLVAAGGDLANQAINEGGIKAGSLLRTLGGLGSMLGPQGAVLGIGAGILGGYLDNRDRALGNYARFQRGEQVSREDFVTGAKAKNTDFMLGLTSFLNPDFADKVAAGRSTSDIKDFDLLAEASRKAADALAGVAQSANAVNSRMDSRSLMARLSGQPESIDLLKSAYSGGGNSGVANLLGNREAMQRVLGYYDTGILQGNDLDRANFARSIGRSDLSNDSGALKALFESIVMPAFSRAADLLGNAGAGGSISGAGSDNSLSFDAPATRVLQVTQAITVNTYAVTGDKASFRALVKDIMAEANTVLGQSV